MKMNTAPRRRTFFIVGIRTNIFFLIYCIIELLFIILVAETSEMGKGMKSKKICVQGGLPLQEAENFSWKKAGSPRKEAKNQKKVEEDVENRTPETRLVWGKKQGVKPTERSSSKRKVEEKLLVSPRPLTLEHLQPRPTALWHMFYMQHVAVLRSPIYQLFPITLKVCELDRSASVLVRTSTTRADFGPIGCGKNVE